MSDYEDRTFKGEDVPVAQRVFFVLTRGGDQEPDSHRVAKALALTLEHLNASGAINDAELDSLLDATTW